jgi:hypothetical protein
VVAALDALEVHYEEPVDHAWGQTKYGEMANFLPQDVANLAQEVAHSLIAKHGRQDLLNAFFQHARLEL